MPNSLDIVSLIETNPLTRLSNEYQNRFIRKIKMHFSDDEQRMFVSSFYCYLNHDPTSEYVIDLEEIWKWLGFSRKDNAKRVLRKYFTVETDYKLALLNSAERKNEGGFNKEQILLNIDTFKSFCLIAGTQKAQEIRKYFIKLEQIMHEVFKEESDELKQKLIRVNKQTLEHKHNILLREFGSHSNIVYIIKVETLGEQSQSFGQSRSLGQYVIKIGESRRGIQGRYNEHKSSYPECLILDCFGVKRSKDFENFLHTKLSPYRYTQLEGHENERELFLVGHELSYSYIMKMINDNIAKYNDDHLEVNKYLLEIEKLKVENENLRLSVQNPHFSICNELKSEIVSAIREELKNFNQTQTQQPTTDRFGNELPTLGPYVQQLNPDNLSLIRVFQHIGEVCSLLRCPRSSLKKAADENTIYLNYRWHLVDRSENPNEVKDVPPTRQLIKNKNPGYIAKLNTDKTEILNVYIDRKTASIKNGYNSVAYLDYFVKHKKEVDSHYYVIYDEVDENIQKTFLDKHNLREIVLYKKFGVGQYDMNNVLVREYKSKHDCQEQLKLGNKTVCKAIETSSHLTLNTNIKYCLRYISDKTSIP
jgi:phage anti-repressor protein